jgi:hypothetical protein
MDSGRSGFVNFKAAPMDYRDSRSGMMTGVRDPDTGEISYRMADLEAAARLLGIESGSVWGGKNQFDLFNSAAQLSDVINNRVATYGAPFGMGIQGVINKPNEFTSLNKYGSNWTNAPPSTPEALRAVATYNELQSYGYPDLSIGAPNAYLNFDASAYQSYPNKTPPAWGGRMTDITQVGTAPTAHVSGFATWAGNPQFAQPYTIDAPDEINNVMARDLTGIGPSMHHPGAFGILDTAQNYPDLDLTPLGLHPSMLAEAPEALPVALTDATEQNLGTPDFDEAFTGFVSKDDPRSTLDQTQPTFSPELGTYLDATTQEQVIGTPDYKVGSFLTGLPGMAVDAVAAPTKSAVQGISEMLGLRAPPSAPPAAPQSVPAIGMPPSAPPMSLEASMPPSARVGDPFAAGRIDSAFQSFPSPGATFDLSPPASIDAATLTGAYPGSTPTLTNFDALMGTTAVPSLGALNPNFAEFGVPGLPGEFQDIAPPAPIDSIIGSVQDSLNNPLDAATFDAEMAAIREEADQRFAMAPMDMGVGRPPGGYTGATPPQTFSSMPSFAEAQRVASPLGNPQDEFGMGVALDAAPRDFVSAPQVNSIGLTGTPLMGFPSFTTPPAAPSYVNTTMPESMTQRPSSWAGLSFDEQMDSYLADNPEVAPGPNTLAAVQHTPDLGLRETFVEQMPAAVDAAVDEEFALDQALAQAQAEARAFFAARAPVENMNMFVGQNFGMAAAQPNIAPQFGVQQSFGIPSPPSLPSIPDLTAGYPSSKLDAMAGAPMAGMTPTFGGLGGSVAAEIAAMDDAAYRANEEAHAAWDAANPPSLPSLSEIDRPQTLPSQIGFASPPLGMQAMLDNFGMAAAQPSVAPQYGVQQDFSVPTPSYPATDQTLADEEAAYVAMNPEATVTNNPPQTNPHNLGALAIEQMGLAPTAPEMPATLTEALFGAQPAAAVDQFAGLYSTPAAPPAITMPETPAPPTSTAASISAGLGGMYGALPAAPEIATPAPPAAPVAPAAPAPAPTPAQAAALEAAVPAAAAVPITPGLPDETAPTPDQLAQAVQTIRDQVPAATTAPTAALATPPSTVSVPEVAVQAPTPTVAAPAPDQFAGQYNTPAARTMGVPDQIEQALTPEQVAATIAAAPTTLGAASAVMAAPPAATPAPAPVAGVAPIGTIDAIGTPPAEAPKTAAPPQQQLGPPTGQLPGPQPNQQVAVTSPTVESPEVQGPGQFSGGFVEGMPTFAGGPLATNMAGDTQPLVGGPPSEFHGGLGGINMGQYANVGINLGPVAEAIGPFMGGPPSPPSDIGVGIGFGGGNFSPEGGFIGGGYTDIGGASTGLDEGSNMDMDADLSGGSYADTGGSYSGGTGTDALGSDAGNYGGPDRDSDDHGW